MNKREDNKTNLVCLFPLRIFLLYSLCISTSLLIEPTGLVKFHLAYYIQAKKKEVLFLQ
jgi:hypothetical protein